ncbi:MAG: U32 family peptidase [Myxococcales bacterium]|nr:U32 family peptidase [Myxococcales bacterium]
MLANDPGPVATTRARHRPEVLAPAGDLEALRAAVRAGADAVYFGLAGFNARARAQNFDRGELRATLAELHAHGVRGHVALNTLVFDDELVAVEAAARACADAGADAVIVQDLGVLGLLRAVAPELPVHASTQMTCTDAGAVALAGALGARRVILPRELSLAEIGAIRRACGLELEVFVHGALCVAYSGQCLTSEAIGGRSANRGACAQACRLPYELYVDGVRRELGERAYLLSPQDLEAAALVPELAELGVASLKIEGRLKGPAYVAATTRLYRAAVDAWSETPGTPALEALRTSTPALEALRTSALQMYSRGSGRGFLEGVDHGRLVEGRACDHRGLELGTSGASVRAHGRTLLAVALAAPVARGDGVLVEGGLAGAGELGGRVWALFEGARGVGSNEPGRAVERAEAGREVLLWLGPERDLAGAVSGRRVWKTDDPAAEKAVLATVGQAPRRVRLDLGVSGALGEPARIEARAATGARAQVTCETPTERARHDGGIVSVLREKLGGLGDTPFELGALEVSLPAGAWIAPGALKRARRALVAALLAAAEVRHPTTAETAAELVARALPPADRPPPPGGLFVLCRTLEQALAAVEAGADGVGLDFLELTGTGKAVAALRARGPVHVTLAPPRIRKPGEEKIDRYLRDLAPEALLVRGLGALHDAARQELPGVLHIGDASLNVTNRLAAAEVLGRGLSAFTPAFDLDATQLAALLGTPFGPWAELVVHHPVPLFHMEHCVMAALLSDGKDHRDCGRPCDRHQVSLRDRAGMVHPVEADVGCRNTVFHAAAQSAAGSVPGARASGVRRFRIELVREPAAEVARLVATYRRLLAGALGPAEVFRTLGTESGYGIVRGSLRVL